MKLQRLFSKSLFWPRCTVFVKLTFSFVLFVVLAESSWAGSCLQEAFKVVLDVGHSVEDGGAFSASGVPEFSFNLALAREIERKLLAEGFKKTDLHITTGKGLLALKSRAAHANETGANLMLSIHHDSVQSSYLESVAQNGTIRHFCDKYSGYSLFVSGKNIHASESIRFATLLSDQLLTNGRLCT